MNRILVVDDDLNVLKVIRMRLEAEGFQIVTASNSEKAVAEATTAPFDLALVDLKLSEEDGIQLMEALHQINAELPIIILTAYGTIQSAVEAMSKGAHSYITKPFDYRELLLQINNCLEKRRLSNEVKRLKNLVESHLGFENIIGKSEPMQDLLAQVAQAARTDSNVYIEGESGTGKELIAKTLHVASARKDGPLVAINCAAIPENLFESELFGHKKGAFTGAAQNKEGLLSQADGGTFFLDEISEMPLSMQAKLLRVLQEKEFYPLGGGAIRKVNARFIATSNRILEESVEKGEFREDLFYRIHVIVLKIPPLRERKEDIPLLAKFFFNKNMQKSEKKIKGFTPAALQKMMLYAWPGNVRELENAVEGAVAMTTQDIITEDLILKGRPFEDEGLKSFKSAKSDFEKRYLVQLMELTFGNISKASELSGKYRADLYDLLKKYNLDPADFRR
ncbi:MAG: sigma-54 dependent transcriptional regulator [Deltaproteobacteria bacterium]|nr:sigma-54 dependent transcriptional regulator [Deltaproteobacteria bacterium]